MYDVCGMIIFKGDVTWLLCLSFRLYRELWWWDKLLYVYISRWYLFFLLCLSFPFLLPPPSSVYLFSKSSFIIYHVTSFPLTTTTTTTAFLRLYAQASFLSMNSRYISLPHYQPVSHTLNFLFLSFSLVFQNTKLLSCYTIHLNLTFSLTKAYYITSRQ